MYKREDSTRRARVLTHPKKVYREGNDYKKWGDRYPRPGMVEEPGDLSFVAPLRIKYGGDPKGITMIDPDGITYPIFYGDFIEIVKHVDAVRGSFYGQWAWRKASRCHGVYMIRELPAP